MPSRTCPHKLHSLNSVLCRHSRTGKTYLRCKECHAQRQRLFRRRHKPELKSLSLPKA